MQRRTVLKMLPVVPLMPAALAQGQDAKEGPIINKIPDFDKSKYDFPVPKLPPVDNKMEPVRAAGLAYTDAGYLIMNFEAFSSIRAQGQPNSPGCNARIAAAPGL